MSLSLSNPAGPPHRVAIYEDSGERRYLTAEEIRMEDTQTRLRKLEEDNKALKLGWSVTTVLWICVIVYLVVGHSGAV